MKKYLLILFTTLTLFANLTLAKDKLPDLQNVSIAKGIDLIRQDTLGDRAEQSHIGIIVQSMKTGKILYQKNAKQLFTPASIQKTLVAVAALQYLKPSYTFITQLLTEGKVVKHTLEGNLYVKFTGDPELTSKALSKFIHQLRSRGIQRIKGHVYIDATAYGNIPYPPGWIWDDLSYSFAAPLMTTIINHNYFTLTLKTPGEKNSHPIVDTNLPANVARFTNDLAVVNSPKKNCPIGIYSHYNNEYILHGCYYRRWKRQVRKIAIRDMPHYTKVLVHDLLTENKIIYNGKVEFKSTPNTAKIVAEHFSPRLREIVKEMLKKSDNLTTDSVFKKLGQTYFKSRGTWQNSLRALKKILAEPTGINFKHNLINDGAGLSRYNMITPMQMSKLLNYAYHNRQIKNSFLYALPIAGRDGTLEYRMRDLARGKRVHAKTGSMTGVAALAGYINTKNLGPVSFVIIINGFVKPRKPYIFFENNICRFLVSAKQHG